MFEWKEEYKLGVDHIDEQHKKLFAIAAKAYELLRNDLAIDKYDSIIEIIQELKDYTIFHFAAEEAYMQQIGHKKILSHKVEHNDFIAKINSIDFAQIDIDQEQYILDILDFVLQWIDRHILEKDKLITELK